MKPQRAQQAIEPAFVAPHAGAWIETVLARLAQIRATVAPHAGAWIETPTSQPLAV